MRKAGAQWMLEHPDIHAEKYFAKMYPAVFEELEALQGGLSNAKVRADQLSFFGKTVQWPPVKGGKVYSTEPPGTPRRTELLGTCVLIHIEDESHTSSFVFEAIVAAASSPERPQDVTNHVAVADVCFVTVGGHEFDMRTSYYCQQNSIFSMCAHSALKTAVWHGNEDSVFQPSTSEMNKIAAAHAPPGVDWKPSMGLNVDQCREICRNFDTDLIAVSFKDGANAGISAYELAYLFIESRWPTIIVFKPTLAEKDVEHVVPVIGHALNKDEWFPVAVGKYPEIPRTPLHTLSRTYLPTTEWVPHLIIHDDLLGPYFALGPNALTRHATAAEDLVGRASEVWAVVPKGFDVTQSPVLAQKNGDFYFRNLWRKYKEEVPEPWRSRLQERWDVPVGEFCPQLVLRTLMVSQEDYRQHLDGARSHTGQTISLSGAAFSALEKLPSQMWMVEFSLPELFSGNHSKVGEILLPLSAGRDADLARAALNSFVPAALGFRMLGNLYLSPPQGPHFNLGIDSHIGLFRREVVQPAPVPLR